MFVNYIFKSDNRYMGTLQINKHTGEVLLVEAMQEDEKRHIFNRAAVKIMREWKQGDLPDLTEWAS